MRKEYNPFLGLDEVVRAGHGDLIRSDGEERGVKGGFIPIEGIHVTGMLHPDSHFLGQFETLDPLQRLLLAEEDKNNVFDKKFSLIVPYEELPILLVSGDLKVSQEVASVVESILESVKNVDSHRNTEDSGVEIKKIPTFFVPFSLSEVLNIRKKFKFSPDSHGNRGRKPVLRKHKRRTLKEKHLLVKEAREKDSANFPNNDSFGSAVEEALQLGVDQSFF